MFNIKFETNKAYKHILFNQCISPEIYCKYAKLFISYIVCDQIKWNIFNAVQPFPVQSILSIAITK